MVQISRELFLKLIKYHCFEMYETEEEIKAELEEKLNALALRESYTKYKAASTEQEREIARRKYLDEKGIPTDFRW